MADTTVIRTELTLEDLASAILKQVQGETKKTSDAVNDSQESFRQLAERGAAFLHNLGINVTDVAGKVLEFGKSFVDAAAEGERADYALAAMIDTAQDAGWDRAIDEASQLGDELDAIAEKTGAVGDLGESFNQLVLFTGASEKGIEAASNRIFDLAQVSRVMGKDVGAVTQEWALMQEGMVRAKSPLFQLIQGTGVLGKDAKKAAAALMSMSEEKRMSVLNEAMDALSGKLKDIPQGFNNTSASLKSVIAAAKEKIGEPFMKAVTPGLMLAVGEMEKLTPDLVALAEDLGKNTGRYIRDGMNFAKNAIAWIRENQEQIAKRIEQAWGFAKDVVSFIVANKEVIAALVIANKGGDLAKGLGAAGKKDDGSAGKLTKFAGAVDAATLAVSTWAIALGQVKKFQDEAEERRNDFSGGIDEWTKQLGEAAGKGDVKKVERLTSEQSIAQVQVGGQSGPGGAASMAASLTKLAMTELSRAKFNAQNIATASSEHYEAIILASQQITAAHQQGSAMENQVAVAKVRQLVEAYNYAAAHGQAANQIYAATIIAGSAALQEAFLKSGLEVAGGMENFASMIQGGTQGFRDKLLGNDKAKATPNMNFALTTNGNVSMQIQQDFRNADPDRVAVIFQKDVQRWAERRFQARTSSPFGT